MNSRFIAGAVAAAALWAGAPPAFAQGRVVDRNASNNPEIYQQTHPEDRSNPQLQGTPRQADRQLERRAPERRRDERYVQPRTRIYVNPPPVFYGAPPIYYGAPPVYYGAPPAYYGAVPQPYASYAPPPMLFRPGDYLPPEYRAQQFVVEDWQWRGLSAPPPGYRWFILAPGSYALVADATGQIAALLAGG
jgi:Ni/Co efflux regulator RcnB